MRLTPDSRPGLRLCRPAGCEIRFHRRMRRARSTRQSRFAGRNSLAQDPSASLRAGFQSWVGRNRNPEPASAGGTLLVCFYPVLATAANKSRGGAPTPGYFASYNVYCRCGGRPGFKPAVAVQRWPSGLRRRSDRTAVPQRVRGFESLCLTSKGPHMVDLRNSRCGGPSRFRANARVVSEVLLKHGRST